MLLAPYTSFPDVPKEHPSKLNTISIAQIGGEPTDGGLCKLFAGLLLPPLPGLEDLAQAGELALALGWRSSISRVPPLTPGRAPLQVYFFIWRRKSQTKEKRSIII